MNTVLKGAIVGIIGAAVYYKLLKPSLG